MNNLLILALINGKTVVPLTIHHGTRGEHQGFLFICLSCFCIGLVRGLMGEEGVIKVGKKRIQVVLLDILSLSC